MSSAQSPMEVFVRFRPATKTSSEVTVEPNKQNMTIVNPVNKQKVAFTFNEIFQNATQEDVYGRICERQVKHVLDGYNACVMATGQTSAGKSYSIIGDEALAYKTRGMVPRALERIFDQQKAQPGTNFAIHFSVLEVLNEKVYDLIAAVQGGPGQAQTQQQVTLLEQQDGSILYRDMQQVQIATVQEALELLFTAENNKRVAATAMNAHSSRSHVIYIVQVAQSSRTDENAQKTISRLYLVDLAGSEKSNNSFINKSLQNLQVCVAQLARQNFHVPFRASKLTQCLRECLGGSSKTAVLGCVRGEDAYLAETLQTLRFCQEAVNIKTEAAVNVVNRLFENSDDARGVNSQVARAVLEAAQQRGGLEGLQQKVVRELEAENQKLKAEIMLLSGKAAEFAMDAESAQSLRQNIDQWVHGAAALPEMRSRVDYEEALAYMKCMVLGLEKQLTMGGFAPTTTAQTVGPTPAADEKVPVTQQQGSRPGSKPAGGKGAPGKAVPDQLPQLFGQLNQTGALAVGTMANLNRAAALGGAATPSPGITDVLGTSLVKSQRVTDTFDENAKFDQFKGTKQGQDLLESLQQERKQTAQLQQDLRNIKDQIAGCGKAIEECKSQVKAKADELRGIAPEGGDDGKGQHNVMNYANNQQQETILVQVRELKLQIERHQKEAERLAEEARGVKGQIEEQKTSEERARRRMMLAFESFCAGLYRVQETAQEATGDDRAYAEVLNRTRKPRRVGRV